MLSLSAPSVSDQLSLEAAITRLKASRRVDGIAEFGSRATSQGDVVSDYDLLVLVKDLPARVFQMVTTIGGRLAGIVLVETATADALLAAQEPPPARSFEALFAQKMKIAHILYDASQRLHRIKELVAGRAWAAQDTKPPSDLEIYAIWFWQSFGLLHLGRMAQSQNPLHRSAVDMMLTSCLPGTWRSYFDLRGIAWEGEKAALRYWSNHDPDYLQTVNTCLASGDQNARLAAYSALVERTIAPIGTVFEKGDTAVILADSVSTLADVQNTLHYWNSLFNS